MVFPSTIRSHSLLSTPPVFAEPPPDSQAPEPSRGAPDLSGRDRLAWNVLVSWAGSMVEIAMGFVVPRLMDRHLGQTTLGVWDLSWSCVAYFRFAQVGIAPATSRFMARYRALGDVEGLRRAASSTAGASLGIATVVLLLTALVTSALPLFVGKGLGDQTAMAQWVVTVLGAGLAFDYLCEVFSGALTGSHRWDLHVGLNAVSNILSATAMVATLLMGGGLIEVALAYAAGGVLSELLRMVVAYRVLPDLRIRPAYFSLAEARAMLSFGTKASVPAVAWLVMAQANVMIVTAHLGPAALALFARPGALLKFPDMLVRRVAMVLSPTASSLQGIGRNREIRELLMRGTRAATALTLPAILGLVILGGPLLYIWMGERYDQGLVLAILALGSAPAFALRPARAVLNGLNLHAFVAIESTTAALLGTALSVVNVMVLDLGLVGAALAVSVPPFLLGLVVPFYVSKKLDIPLRDLLREGFLVPSACAVPFGLVLLVSRLLFDGQPLLAVGVGSLAGALVLLPLYWKYVAPQQLRQLVLARLPEALARRPSRVPS